ncbi:adenylyltransferase and sulfurtransferase MOCS3-like [Ruditapes philippinarum]|uniref:adenylyltransferase and sulfurtransferase MOCS3-like n=1 Tax=Ruditapes philippinarum TaxID=129788 RepID=UPI00295B0BDF|nr:adenylyltransferase and sulfurtransferase MOCS3-like [Ruditapes philippinarum]
MSALPTVMEPQDEEITKLLSIIEEKNREIERLRSVNVLKVTPTDVYTESDVEHCKKPCAKKDKLINAEISRYSRQLILPEIGVKGQISLGNTSVLIVGAGGLGCPSAVYLAAAGIGCLGLVDFDEVDLSNLHRQILHSEVKVGMQKSLSAAQACNSLNSFVKCVPYHLPLNSSNALDIIQQYDIVLDCTDNVATRYLLNDACILAGKPLVSGSALRFEGQLTVYNYKGGPCYRCLYPKPPPPETVTNCSDGGVLGVIPGIIGSLQALEAIKIAAGLDSSYSQKLLMYDGLDGTFRTIRLRGRQPTCPVCGDNPTITQLIDYEQFCGAKATDKDKNIEVLGTNDRITAKEYKSLLDSGQPHVLLDVRQPVEMDICQLPKSAVNIPIGAIHKSSSIDQLSASIDSLGQTTEQVPVICVCRRGNDSQLAVQKIKQELSTHKAVIKDIKGGLTAWAKTVDPEFPTY